MKKEILKRYKSVLNTKLSEEAEIADGIDPTEEVDEFDTDFEDIFDTEDGYIDELVDKVESDSDEVSDTDTEEMQEIENSESTSLNSLYTNGDDYKETPFKYVNGYWIAILGILALAKKFPECPIIHNYLTKPAPITEESLLENGDYFTDPIAAVKALKDNDTMKYFTWNDYVNLFLELNGNYYREVDEDKLRDLSSEMIFVDIMPHHMIRETIVRFMNSDMSLDECIEPLYKFNLMFSISPKFQEFCIVHKDELSFTKPQKKENDYEEVGAQ